MKKIVLVFLQIFILMSVCFAADKKDEEKKNAIYVAPSAMIEIDAKQGLASVLPGANIVYERKNYREATLVSAGFFYGLEGFADVLNLKRDTGIAVATKAKSSSSFVIPLNVITTITPVRAENWKFQLTTSVGIRFIIANAVYQNPKNSSSELKSKYFEFSPTVGFGAGMWHDFENNVYLRYGFDFLLPFGSYSTVRVEDSNGSKVGDPFPEMEFFNGRFAMMPYISVGYSF